MSVRYSENKLIHALCDQFEAAWLETPPPRMEDYVDTFPLVHGEQLFVALLKIDLKHRQRELDAASIEEYTKRFPNYAQAILDEASRLEPAPVVNAAGDLQRLGDYRLLDKLGQGGMGVVYKAMHEVLGKTVAVKVLPPDRDNKAALDRFRMEMRSLGPLEHPNIVRASDAGERDGVLYLVMEFVEGKDLEQLLRAKGQLSIEAACEIIRQAALGLQHIHEHQLVHRDIKPSNMMLCSSGAVKILDLGLARPTAERLGVGGKLTHSGQMMGTVDYMAPEQVEDASDAEIQADIYSLGCTLFHLLVGHGPYANVGGGMIPRLMAHRSSPIPSVTAHRQDCPTQLDAIIQQMLAKRPEDRYERPRDVAELLAPLCGSAGRDAVLEFAQELGAQKISESATVETAPPTVTAQIYPCPFPGLRAFARGEGDLFFGREEHVEQLAAKLDEHRFLPVVGPSGCGKSSLVLAGLLDHISNGFVEGVGPHWREAVMRPGEAPFERLTTALLHEDALGRERGTNPAAAGNLQATLRRGPWGLADALKETGLESGTNLVLVVDQFEELFRYRQSLAEGQYQKNDAEAFVNLLVTPTKESAERDQRLPSLAIYVVLTMRWDFLDEQFYFSGLTEMMNRCVFFTPRMTRDQCQSAIFGPARIHEWDIDAVLANRLLNDTATEQDQLPLIQHTLMRMWTRAAGRGKVPDKSGGRLALEDYVANPDKELSEHADEIMARCGAEKARVARKMFQMLCTSEDSRRDTRRPVSVGDIAKVADTDIAEVKKVADAFRSRKASFLMPPETVDLHEDTILDISHECLIRKWETLRNWIDEEAQHIGIFRRLARAARRWRAGRQDSFTGLEEALEWRQQEQPNAAWAARYGNDFELVMDFLNHCQAHQRPSQQREFDFDVFLCHGPEDQPAVLEIAVQLKASQTLPWLDLWELPPGKSWHQEIHSRLDQIGAVSVFVSSTGQEDWQRSQWETVVKQFVQRNRPVIPVILPGSNREVPSWLRSFTCVDFRLKNPDPMDRLIWGITGSQPNR